MPKRPSRIELLELDIDLRLADLWREADDITEWNIEIVAAFMRAAYGKGYCDALTEESPGELCHEHGYRVPPRRGRDPAGVVGRTARYGRDEPGLESRRAFSRSPARLIVALSIAGALAIFLLYTAIAGRATATIKPSQLTSHAGRVQIVGTVIGPVTGDSYSAGRPALPDA